MIIINIHGNCTISIIAVFICLQLHGNRYDNILSILPVPFYGKVIANRLSILRLTGKVVLKGFIVSWKLKIMEYCGGTVYASNRQILSIIFTQEVSILWCMPSRKCHALVTFFKKFLFPFFQCFLWSFIILSRFCNTHGILLGIQLLTAKHNTLRWKIFYIFKLLFLPFSRFRYKRQACL